MSYYPTLPAVSKALIVAAVCCFSAYLVSQGWEFWPIALVVLTLIAEVE